MNDMSMQSVVRLLTLVGTLLAVSFPALAESARESERFFDQMFADRFDDCSLQQWSIATNLTDANVGQQGGGNRRYSGECGLRVPIDSSTFRAIIDDEPIGETSFIVRFYANFDGYGNEELLLLDAAPSSRFQIRYNYPTENDISVIANDNNSSQNFLTFENIGSGWHSIEVVWEASTSSTIRFSVNGLDDMTVTINNSGHSINSIAIGNLFPGIAGSGFVDIDAYDSRRLSRPGRLLVGDANGDGVIDQADVDAVIDEINGTAFAMGQPDCNEDGNITTQDVECIESLMDPGATRIIQLSGSLDFGEVEVGQSADSTLTIGNSGTDTLVVTGINHPTGFDGNWSGSIPPDGTAPVTITFQPSAEQTYSGQIEVLSDATSGDGTHPVSGVGVVDDEPGTPSISRGDALWHDDFRARGWTPVRFATVELRSAQGQVKASTSSDVLGNFPVFMTGQISAGDKLVVYGGYWGGKPFAGELHLLFGGPEDSQIVTPVTTLVNAVAAADFISGATPAARLNSALTWLTDLYMIDADWNTNRPSRAESTLEAITATGGVQNWVLALLPYIEAADVPDEWMDQFPEINAGVLEVGLGEGRLEWIPEDVGQVSLVVISSLQPEPEWSFTLQDGPAWIELDADGTLAYSVPSDQSAGAGSVQIEVNNLDTGQSRTMSVPFEVLDANVVAEISVDQSGAVVWHPSGTFGIEALENTFSTTVTLQLLDVATEDGGIRSRFRMLPLDTEPQRGLIFRAAEDMDAAMSRSGHDCTVSSDLFEEGWIGQGCWFGSYVSVNRPWRPGNIVSVQRLPSGLQDYEFPEDYAFEEVEVKPAALLFSRCDDCFGKTPLVFVHGYRSKDFLEPNPPFSGGADYWGDLRQLFHDFDDGEQYAVYEFRYRSNARFHDIARDLGEAVALANAQTGQKAHVIAHSFGGLVARTYLQGLTTNRAVISSSADGSRSSHPHVETLITIGSPHSGISGEATEQHGILLPEGQDSALIRTCGQLSCWQAGASARVFGSDSASDLAGAFGVQDTPGEVIAGLADFSASPLPVPTLALLSMDTTRRSGYRRYRAGDSLISYQGLRFSPHLSCSESTCDNMPVQSASLISIGGQPIGNTLTEGILGKGLPLQAQPLPGDSIISTGGDVLPIYRHSKGTRTGRTSTSQPFVERADHLPNLDSDGSWASSHDTFNQLYAWLDPGPPERNILLQIDGQGSVQIDSGGEQFQCNTNCFVPVPADTATLTANPAIGASFDQFVDCPSVSGNQCDLAVGPRTPVTARFIGGNAVQLTVNVAGDGVVAVSPGNDQCTDTCVYEFEPGTVILDADHVGFSGWSGVCSGDDFQCTINLNTAGASASATASYSSDALPPIATGLLNDTGIDWCANNNSNFLSCPVASHPGQDADYGRDALARQGLLEKVGAGSAGFDYTKLDASGNDLPASAAQWSCVRDNHTGLTWEVKVDDPANLRHRDHFYTWYNPDPNTNGGAVGVQDGGVCAGSDCDTHGFTQAVNGQGYCGNSDWRVPTVQEFHTLFHFGQTAPPAIDVDYFPNTASFIYNTASPSAGDQDAAWIAHFNDGSIFRLPKGQSWRVRLVRGNPEFPEGSGGIQAQVCGNAAISPSTPSEHFSVVGNGSVVRHEVTGLEWQRCSVGQNWNGLTCVGNATILDWNTALNLPDAVNTEWRLPKINELYSLLEYCNSNPAINAEVFPNSGGRFWSSSPTGYWPKSVSVWALDIFPTPGSFEGSSVWPWFESGLVRLVRE